MGDKFKSTLCYFNKKIEVQSVQYVVSSCQAGRWPRCCTAGNKAACEYDALVYNPDYFAKAQEKCDGRQKCDKLNAESLSLTDGAGICDNIPVTKTDVVAIYYACGKNTLHMIPMNLN